MMRGIAKRACDGQVSGVRFASHMKRAASLLGLFLTMACGGTTASQPAPVKDAGVDTSQDIDSAPPVDNGAPSSVYPAFQVGVPQVVNPNMGPVLTHTRIVPAFYPKDDYQQNTTDFLAQLAPSKRWAEMLGEYGVIDATVTAPVAIQDAPPTTIDDAAIKKWLASNLDGTHAEWPAPDDGTVYVIFYPASTAITFQGTQSCQTFGGYHNEAVLGSGKKVAYAIIPRCMGTFNLRSAVLSHELVEAASDPLPNLGPAFGQLDDKHLAWMLTNSGGEIGDMCQMDPLANYQIPDLGFANVQRSWSNKSALAHHDPCVPRLPNHVYFNSTPLLPETVSVTVPALSMFGMAAGKTFKVEGVTIPIGQKKTIEVDLWSDDDTKGPWSVEAVDVLADRYNIPSTLSFEWDRKTGVNGEKLHLTITAVSTSLLQASVFEIISTKSPQKFSWTGVVAN